MKKALIYLAGATLLAAACRGRGSRESLQREQKQYDVVQEGQNSTAVTSTINAPGEVVRPAAGMTGTNADTTSNFTLPQVSSTAPPTQPGTIAGTLTIPGSSGPMIGYPANPPKPRRPQPKVAPQPAPTETTATSVEGPPSTTSTIPPTTDTAPPPPTDTQPPPTTTTT